MTIPLGGLITLAVLLPNFLALSRPGEQPNSLEPNNLRKVELLERAGQAGTFVIPFFYQISVSALQDEVALALMMIFLALYYGGWWRYARGGKMEVLLYKPILGIPLGMAVLPVLYFLAASILLHSLYLAVAAGILGFAHIRVSRAAQRRLETPPR
ncbi:MAG TPA: hypothetical protein VL126_11540 [Bacteroidota bacterium]|nr:hypothetical protein [Bacteroidota bacterium]